MESVEDSKVLTNNMSDIPKSASGFPNKTPTYVVAFALKETYDDLVTAQQMICNKRSPQESTNSITPTNSLKMFDSGQAEKMDEISDILENSVKEKDEIIENSISKVIVSRDSYIKNTDSQREILFLSESDEPTENSNEDIEDNFDQLNQPEVIFNAINYGRRSKDIKYLRKSKNYKNTKPKFNKFKCKYQKNIPSNHFEKYCTKARRNSVNSEQIQKRFSNISTVVSRTTILKNGSAKENLLEETEMISILNHTFDEQEDGSLSSHPSTTKIKSFISNSSGKTLTQKSSTSSKNEDGHSTGTVKSAYEISPETTAPFKTDVNVAVAVTYKQSYIINKDEISESNNKNLKYKRSLTSSDEMIIVDMVPLTSEITSGILKTNEVNKVDSMNVSDATLVNKSSSFGACSDDDTYDMARTSSDFNETNNDSTFTLKNSQEDDENESEVIETSENNEVADKTRLKKQDVPDTVINLGYYPEVTASTSSDVTFGFDLNDVIITKHKNHGCEDKNKGDICCPEKVDTNILKKQFNQHDVTPTSKFLNLPNEAKIKIMLDEKGNQQLKCDNDSLLYPSNITEMWDRLVIVLDIAFKRLGESITGKIVNELKNSIAVLEAHIKPIPECDLDLEKGDLVVIEPPLLNVVTSTQRLKEEVDKSLQCDLVHNKIIDQIVMKLSSQGPKIMDPGLSVKSLQKLKRPKLLKDYVEILKPPVVETSQDLVDKTETVTFSTITVETVRLRRLRTLFFGPLKFLKENLFVITSVPAFFVILLFLYGLILLLMKPW